ncbi:MAG TPA: hypothetical protein VM325_12035 [Alphaproteobacteria bacterium]|nr:hypothetical protein [Alphaproteobacteria bacterium]
MLRSARIIVVFAAFFATACVPETETFLSDRLAQPLDKRLVGTWYMLERDAREVVVLSVRRTKDGRFSVIWTELKPHRLDDNDSPPVQFVRYFGHTTRLGKANFINLTLVDRTAWKTGTPKRFIMRYWLRKNGLRIAFMKNDVFKDAVKEGRLAGRLVDNNGVIITAKRKALLAFIRKTGPDKAFAKPTKPLRRMRATE